MVRGEGVEEWWERVWGSSYGLHSPVVPVVSNSASGTKNKPPFATDFILLKLKNELLITDTTPNFFYTDVV